MKERLIEKKDAMLQAYDNVIEAFRVFNQRSNDYRIAIKEYGKTKKLFKKVRPKFLFKKLSIEELDLLKLSLIHSTVGWDAKGEPLPWMTKLLKTVDSAMGEPNVWDKDYSYSKFN